MTWELIDIATDDTNGEEAVAATLCSLRGGARRGVRPPDMATTGVGMDLVSLRPDPALRWLDLRRAVVEALGTVAEAIGARQWREGQRQLCRGVCDRICGRVAVTPPAGLRYAC
jgi:hypothetical protein